MKLTTYMLACLGMGLCLNAAAGVKEMKVVNGCRIVRIKTGGIICPSTTTLCFYRTNTPGELLPLNSASNPGILGMTAGAAGTATSGGLIRPAKVNVEQGGPSSDNFVPVTVTTPPAGNPGGNNGNGGNPHFN